MLHSNTEVYCVGHCIVDYFEFYVLRNKWCNGENKTIVI